MTVFITEYSGGFLSGRPLFPGVPTGVPVQTQTLTTGSTFALSSKTQMLMVSADVGSWLFLGSSGSTISSTQILSTAQTSTNPTGASLRVSSGLAPFPVSVSPYMRAIAMST